MKQKLFALFLLLTAGLANAGTITLSYVDSGWYDTYGNHLNINENYIAGFYNNNLYRNFFVFDTSSIMGQITSAKLRINSGFVDTTGPYTLSDVTSNIGTLRAGGFGLTSIFNDLGTGTVYGATTLFSSPDWVTVDIALNADAIAALNSADGLFALGGKYGSGSYAFGSTHLANPVRELVIETSEVPEPLSTALLGIGLIGLGLARRSKRA